MGPRAESISGATWHRAAPRLTARLLWVAVVLLALDLTVQGAHVPRIGVLSPYAASGSSFQDDVKRGLADLGYVEGTTINYDPFALPPISNVDLLCNCQSIVDFNTKITNGAFDLSVTKKQLGPRPNITS